MERCAPATTRMSFSVMAPDRRSRPRWEPQPTAHRAAAESRPGEIGAWLIAIFLVPVTITVHGVLMLTAPDETMQRIHLSFFLKGVTMTGAALIFTRLGVAATASKPLIDPSHSNEERPTAAMVTRATRCPQPLVLLAPPSAGEVYGIGVHLLHRDPDSRLTKAPLRPDLRRGGRPGPDAGRTDRGPRDLPR